MKIVSAGRKNFDPETDKGTMNAYGQTVHFYQPEVFTKTGFRFDANRKFPCLPHLLRKISNPGLG